MSSLRLDDNLLKKIAERKLKPEKYVREQISKRASRLGVPSEVAQILWAKELGVSATVALRNLAPHMQEQVRTTLSVALPKQRTPPASKDKTGARPRARTVDTLSQTIDYLLTDTELKSRCSDLLKKRQHQDRVFREATTVLENRVKRLAHIKARMNPEALINHALNPDPTKAILIVSSESSEQAGFHSICRGIVLSFRNRAHHELDDSITQVDALKFCCFIDVILAILATSQAKLSP